MILAIDVYYTDSGYKTCGVLFEKFDSKEPIKVLTLKSHKPVQEYIPGQFYKRELPCIIEFLKFYKIHPDYLIIDGYINLLFDNGSITRGIGAYVKVTLENMHGYEHTKIIGIAKSSFARNDEISIKVCRGRSKNPLYVQSQDNSITSQVVENMYGQYRIPEMLKIMDFHTKHDSEYEICNEIF